MARRLSAYFYHFVPTGADAIDEILEAVARAGKAFHHTEEWNEPDQDGRSQVDKIQDAANRAHAAERELLEVLKAAVAAHQFLTPAHTHNCRFCDLNMDDEGTGQDMHASDCWMHQARSAIAKATPTPEKDNDAA